MKPRTSFGGVEDGGVVLPLVTENLSDFAEIIK